MYQLRRHKKSQAFALPTVLIASIVLLTILAVSVTATVAVRTVLKNQYYIQLAQVAGESGVAYAKACLALSGNIPLWSDAKPLTPATDCSGNVILSPNVKALIVAGGGSGGGSAGGGGGAGGLIYNTSVGVTATSYPVVIGAGAAGTAQQTSGISGANTTFNGLTAIGGGGGSYANGTTGGPGLAGGSGGGGENFFSSYAAGTGTAGQGNAGGAAGGGGSGGGGGAGGLGNVGAATNIGGAGGLGSQYNISGSMVYYAGGGGGGGVSGGAGGSGIGGTGISNGTAGLVNSGSGGGGGWLYSGGSGGAGGSGIVIISYPSNSGIVATGGTVTTSGTNKINTFTSSGTFTVSSVGTASCPSDPKCSVMVNGNVRSSFSVPKPVIDATTGQAVTISNNGYVEITRTSTGAVFRTYKQPSVQAVVVPNLCSGKATAALGWNSSVLATTQDSLPSSSIARSITLATGNLPAGAIYFRKDFSITNPGSYDLNVLTDTSQDLAETYIDSTLVSTSNGSLATTGVSLTTGCHTLMVRLTNSTALARATQFTASLTQSGAAGSVPIFVTDRTWRVTSSSPVHFSLPNYFESPNYWDAAKVFGVWNNTTLPWAGAPTNWATVSGDTLASYISTNYVTSGISDPGDSYAWLRSTRSFTTTTVDTIRVTNACDDRCTLYLDGVQVLDSASGAGIVSTSLTVQPGVHNFGIRLYNAPTVDVGAALFAAYDTTTSTVVSRSDAGWDTTNFWTTTVTDLSSYDRTYLPNPSPINSRSVKVLVVGAGGAGGGGYQGGGGGAGGMTSIAAYPLTVANYNVVVGAGGAGGGTNTPNSGGWSLFDSIRSAGGGYGGGQPSGLTVYPISGGSGGGGSYPQPSFLGPGTISQGNNGGLGFTSPYVGGGGGGAGAAGATATASAAGAGGAGLVDTITGTSVYYAGGGGGAARATATNALGGSSIGGNGGATGTSGAVNTGSGGGGGGTSGAAGISGSGGSGVVIIAFPTGTITFSYSGAYTTLPASGGFSIYQLTGSGTLTITAVS